MNNVYSFRVNRIILAESGSYHDMYAMPYRPLIDEKIENILSDEYHRSHKFVPENIAKRCPSILQPSVEYGTKVPIYVPNGFGTRRYSYIMFCELTAPMGNKVNMIATGMTNYADCSLQTRRLADDTLFYLNNVITTKVTRSRRGYESTRIIKADQVLSNAYQHHDRLMDRPYPGMGRDGAYNTICMRPTDLFTLSSALDTLNAYGGSDETYVHQSMADNSIQLSDRTNSIPSEYVSRTLNVAAKAVDHQKRSGGYGYPDDDDVGIDMSPYDEPGVRFGESRGDIMVGMLYETDRAENDLIETLNHISDGIQSEGSFSLKELRELDPHCTDDNVMIIHNNDNMERSVTDYASYTSPWGERSTEELIARMVTTSLPAIMIRSKMAVITFDITNMNTLGTPLVNWDTKRNKRPGDPEDDCPLAPMDYADLSSEEILDRLRFIENFLIDELWPCITKNNVIDCTLHVRADFIKDTKVDVQIERNPFYTKVAPTFMDNLMSPIITPDRQGYHNMSTSFRSLVDDIRL